MGIGELLLLAVGLSMDAFAVSVCKGLALRRATFQAEITCGVWFGAGQALFPLAGYFLGSRFGQLMSTIGPWVAFVLLAIIGGNMVRESFGEEEELDDDFSAKAMLPLTVADSIDAFAAGVGFAAVNVNIVPAVSLIGIITCVLSAAGVKVGALFGSKYRAPAERAGGVVLVLMGLKTLLSGLGIL